MAETTETANDRFERRAAEFERATGMLAPGKDDAIGSHPYEDRIAAWKSWCAANPDTPLPSVSERPAAGEAPTPLGSMTVKLTQEMIDRATPKPGAFTEWAAALPPVDGEAGARVIVCCENGDRGDGHDCMKQPAPPPSAGATEGEPEDTEELVDSVRTGIYNDDRATRQEVKSALDALAALHRRITELEGERERQTVQRIVAESALAESRRQYEALAKAMDEAMDDIDNEAFRCAWRTLDAALTASRTEPAGGKEDGA